MQRRFLPALADHGSSYGTFATKWEHWKNPRKRVGLDYEWDRINVSHPDDIDDIDDAMGLYVALYEPSPGRKYVAYVGYSKGVRTELKIRYGKWDAKRMLVPRWSHFPFAAIYIPNQRTARCYEDDLIRYYCPPWNTKFHR
jgi:hypothetical protein